MSIENTLIKCLGGTLPSRPMAVNRCSLRNHHLGEIWRQKVIVGTLILLLKNMENHLCESFIISNNKTITYNTRAYPAFGMV